MAKPKLQRAAADPNDMYTILGLLKQALIGKDPNADVAVGTKPGQSLVTFKTKVFEIDVRERKG